VVTVERNVAGAAGAPRIANRRIATESRLASASDERGPRVVMNFLLLAIGATLILVGLAGAIVPALPGIPLIFGGIWLVAGVDHYRHVGLWWLVGIAVVGAIGLTVDLLAGSLGAKRVGASKQAVWGALAGTLIGLLFGLPGLLLGPFLGAVLGELGAGNGPMRSTQVGVGAWLGSILGTLIKLASSWMMVVLFCAGWWWNRGP
jgi:uncharacterized protein YqgC (DUF456 family)